MLTLGGSHVVGENLGWILYIFLFGGKVMDVTAIFRIPNTGKINIYFFLILIKSVLVTFADLTTATVARLVCICGQYLSREWLRVRFHIQPGY